MTHTPGPWYAYRADYQGRPDEAPIFVVGPSEFHTVAKVRAGNTDDDLPKQTEANALLIAAAPELLAALKAVLTVWHDATATRHDDAAAEAAALAAIAKAEGST
jgi:hypothetical protein